MSSSAPGEDLLWLMHQLADGDWHSGEALASEAGISRAALSKRVGQLSRFGVQVASRSGLGYQLLTPFEPLSLDALQLPDGLRGSVVRVTESTNADLLAADAAHDPQIRFAEFQTAGRGRRGRVWQAPYGQQLMMSLAWSFASWPDDLGCLPLAVGCRLAETLHRLGATAVQVKWPNDLVVDGCKLGGILLEHRGEIGGACRVIIGLGLNLQRFADDRVPDQPWISLDQLLPVPVARNAVAAAISQALFALLSDYPTAGFAACRDSWQRLDASFGRFVRIIGVGPMIEGLAQGVDARGALQVQAADGLHSVFSGEVSMRWA
ncbi:MAG: biotin--[acetyl-CoA-carboxylase] ligase [Polycyclovorans sp.]